MPEITVMTPEETTHLSTQLKRHEGLSLTAYPDSEGILTIGYGHNCESAPVPGVSQPGDSITQETADRLFDADLAAAVWDVRHNMPWASAMNTARQGVLVNMLFNLGVGRLLGFKKALAAMTRGDYAAAAKEMLWNGPDNPTKWARQVGPRATELARQMETGEWQSN